MHKVIAITSILVAFSTFALAGESDIQVFDQDYKREMIIKQKDNHFDVFDRSYNRRGYIRDNDIYNNRHERRGSIYEGGDQWPTRNYR